MINRALLLAITVLATVSTSDALAAMGRTAGNFAVSATGAAQYSIPLWTPSGPNGIQPSLAITYNSQSGIGPLGVGWSVSGLGAITRCNKTYAQDTTPAPVALGTADGYCLNGNRLRLYSGTYGVAGSTYQTEIADFSLVTANGTAGNGPATFTVQGKNGLTYQYGLTDTNGNGANSAVLATGTSTVDFWLLSKVIDRNGNNYVINYLTQTGSAVPDTMLWTPTGAGASTYVYTMKFNYGANVPQSSVSKYISGTVVSNAQLLSSLTISASGTLLKDYFLDYQTSPTTGRDELTFVTECADAVKANCLLPTSVTYKNGASGVSASTAIASSSSGLGLSARYDLNGDGILDLVYSSGNLWYVQFGSASGFGAPVAIGSSVVLIGNINGGNRDGLLSVIGGVWWYYVWNGSSFVGTSTGLAYDSTALQWQLADIDGDGLPDLVSMHTKTTGGVIPHTIFFINVQKNTSSGISFSFSTAVLATVTVPNSSQLVTPESQYGKTRRLDFNGDGRDDLAIVAGTVNGGVASIATWELISTGSGFTTFIASVLPGTVYKPLQFGNWNDDACTDFVAYNTLYISGCNGANGATFAVGNVVASMDWDGDGRTDLIVGNDPSPTLSVYLSTGVGVSSLIATTIPYTSTCQYFTTDANGDGLDDLGCWNQAAPGPITYRLHNGSSQPPDLVSSIKDGYGNSASPTYVPLTTGGVYNRYSDAVFPYKDYVGPMYVTSQAVFSDSSNLATGTYNKQYYYYGA